MDIIKVVNINQVDCEGFRDHSKDVAIMKAKGETLLCDEDGSIYFGDNPALLGLFIGTDSPVLERILEVIEEFDETQVKFTINDNIDCIFTPDLDNSEEDNKENIKLLEEK